MAIDNDSDRTEEPVLPFQNIESDARLAEIFQSVKDKIITSLEANNFSKT